MSVGLSVGWSVSTQLSKKFKMCSFNNTYPAEAYSCLQVCVYFVVDVDVMALLIVADHIINTDLQAGMCFGWESILK